MTGKIERITFETVLEQCCRLGYMLPIGSCLWGIPRGGTLVALLMNYISPEREFTVHLDETPRANDIVIDDVLETGQQLSRYSIHHTCAVLYCSSNYLSLALGGVKHATTIEHANYLLMPWETEHEAKVWQKKQATDAEADALHPFE